MKSAKKYYLKERINPQLGTYWVRCGQMSKAAAKRAEEPLYGENVMHEFDSLLAYTQRINELVRTGAHVQ